MILTRASLATLNVMQPVVSTAFLALHLGAAYATAQMIRFFWDKREVFLIVYGEKSWLVAALFVGVIALAARATIGTARRLWRRRPEVAIGLRLRALVYLILANIVASTFFLYSYFQLPEACLVLTYGVWVLWSNRLARIPETSSRSLRRRTDVLCMMVTVLLVFGEFGLRAVAVVAPSPLFSTSAADEPLSLATQRQKPGTKRFGFPVNEGGFYDGEFFPRSSDPDRRRIICIGDSFSLGSVPHPYHYTTVCERVLVDTDVYNMGVTNIGLHGYAHLLEHEALPLQPDLVVVALFMGNDLTDGLVEKSIPRWYDRHSYLLPVVWRRMSILKRKEGSWLGYEELAVEHPWLSDPLLERPTFDSELFFGIEVGRARRICGADLQPYQHFSYCFENLRRAGAPTRLAFMLIPDEFQVEDHLWDEIVSGTEEELDRDLPQRKVVQFLEGQGYPVLDLLLDLRAIEPLSDGRRHVFHLQDTHFNARGNEVAGRALAKFVEALLETERADLSATIKARELLFIASLEGSLAQVDELPPLQSIPRDQANEIIKSYGAVLGKVRLDRQRVVDVALLPHAKRRIEAVLFSMMEVKTEQRDQEFLRAALLMLAYFREGVGPGGARIDTVGPGGRPWREGVEADLQAFSRGLLESK